MTTHELHIGQRVVMIDQPTDVGIITNVKRGARGLQFIVEFADGDVGWVYGRALLLVSPVAA